MKPVEWQNNKIIILDQTKLPDEISYECLSTVDEVAGAIKTLMVRGAPLIGVVAAFGMVLAAAEGGGTVDQMDSGLRQAYQKLHATRPTAVNLKWALDRMIQKFEAVRELAGDTIIAQLLDEADTILEEDLKTNQKIGENGSILLKENSRVLTVCNAGALATAGYGTALGIVRSAFHSGRLQKVWACETRPVLQGARLTVLELSQDGIPVVLITDSMAGYVMQMGEVDAVITGADRIAANGDTANKIGTYTLAVLANHHRIPFYVAAPLSTIDLNITGGTEIPIETRDPDEVRKLGGRLVTLPEVPVCNPAFDVTPAGLITAIITEKGIIRPPYLGRISIAAGNK